MFIKSNQGGVMSARRAYPTRMRFAEKGDLRPGNCFNLSSQGDGCRLITCYAFEATGNLSNGRSGTLHICERDDLPSEEMILQTEGRGRLVVEVGEVIDWSVVRSFIPVEWWSSAMVSCAHVCAHARYARFVIAW